MWETRLCLGSVPIIFSSGAAHDELLVLSWCFGVEGGHVLVSGISSLLGVFLELVERSLFIRQTGTKACKHSDKFCQMFLK